MIAISCFAIRACIVIFRKLHLLICKCVCILTGCSLLQIANRTFLSIALASVALPCTNSKNTKVATLVVEMYGVLVASGCVTPGLSYRVEASECVAALQARPRGRANRMHASYLHRIGLVLCIRYYRQASARASQAVANGVTVHAHLTRAREAQTQHHGRDIRWRFGRQHPRRHWQLVGCSRRVAQRHGGWPSIGGQSD